MKQYKVQVYLPPEALYDIRDAGSKGWRRSDWKLQRVHELVGSAVLLEIRKRGCAL